jgi:GT2 family glycosyltransferase
LASPAARVYVVILNYRHADDTLRCLGTLRRSTYRWQFPVIVDNGSGTDVVAALRAGAGATRLLVAPDNLGYAGGNNLGIRHALDHRADYIWILNPDTEIEPDALAQLVTTMDEQPDVGMVGSRVLYGGSVPPRISADGGRIDWLRGGATEHVSDGRPESDVPATEPFPVDYASGTSMLVRADVLRRVGLLPEHYFLYFEETAFSIQVARHGWRVLVNPRSRVWHHKRSYGSVPQPYYVYYFVRNRLLFGTEFTELDVDAIARDLQTWVDAWRAKVAKAAPDWLGTFDQLVSWALADGREGRSGRRRDIEDLLPGVLYA